MKNAMTKANATKMVPCPKCFGTKVFKCWSHIEGGACFRCGGAGEIEYREPRNPPKTRAKQENAAWRAKIELENLYGAACSHVADGARCWWGGYDNDYSPVRYIAYYMTDAAPSVAKNAREAFVELLGPAFERDLDKELEKLTK